MKRNFKEINKNSNEVQNKKQNHENNNENISTLLTSNNLPPPLLSSSSTTNSTTGITITSNNSSYFLIHQNKELERELKRRKERLNELEERSAYYDGQIVKIEEFIGFMDRVWNQFEYDISLLIQGITSHSQNSESESNNQSNLEYEDHQQEQQEHQEQQFNEEGEIDQHQNEGEIEINNEIDRDDNIDIEVQGHDQGECDVEVNEVMEEQDSGNRDNLGDENDQHNKHDENEQENQSWSSLLQQYLNANQTFFELVPCSITNELDIDEWSNDHEIEEAKLQALEVILDSTTGLEDVKEELINRLEFTKKNVERLYDIINQQTDGQFAISLMSLVDDRNYRAEIDLLRDQVTKYKHEVITISAELAYSQRKLKKAEKQILYLTETNTQLNNLPAPQLLHLSSTQSNISIGSERKDSLPLGGGNENQNQELLSVVDEVVKETPLCQQNGVILDSRMVIQEAVNKLLQQLQESQQRMLNAEKTLTEYMTTIPNSQPVSNSAEIIRLQKLLTEVRTVSNKRLAEVRAEKAALMTKISDMERVMNELVTKTESTIQQMSNACEEQLEKEKTEKDKLLLTLKSMEAEVKLMSNMQSQVNEMQLIHDNSKSKVDTLTEKIKAQTTTISILENNLQSSKQREEALELSLQELSNKLYQEEEIIQHNKNKENEKEIEKVDGSEKQYHQHQHHQQQNHDNNNNTNNTQQEEESSSKTLKLINDDEEEGVVYENTPSLLVENHSSKKSFEIVSQLLSQAQARCKELENELADAKANMDELIVEIEAVANEEEKMRQQNTRLLKQITEGHNVHKAVLQENLRLHQDITTLHEKEVLASTKVENMTNQMKLNDSVLQQLKLSEQNIRSEISANAIIISESKITIETQKKTIEEHENKIKLQQTNLENYETKLNELKERCNNLNDQCEDERNKRMELERLREQDKIEREKEANKIAALMSKITENNLNNNNNSSSTTQTDEMKMLEMTLNMLRCSVCKDRFKQVIITKCYHLFCKECINENLKNRNRKCPACGEKFGQDDVKLVYFAH